MNWQDCKLDSEETYWEWPDHCAAWNLYFIQKRYARTVSDTTTATGCTLGVKHPFSSKLVGQRWKIASTSKKLLDRITLSCQGGHHEIKNSYHTLGIPFPDALVRRICRIQMETTPREEVFAFIAAAAAGTGNDDHQKEYKKP